MWKEERRKGKEIEKGKKGGGRKEERYIQLGMDSNLDLDFGF